MNHEVPQPIAATRSPGWGEPSRLLEPVRQLAANSQVEMRFLRGRIRPVTWNLRWGDGAELFDEASRLQRLFAHLRHDHAPIEVLLYKLRSLYAMLFASCGPVGSDLDDHPSLAHRAESWWLKLKRIAAWFVVAAERFAAAAGQ